MEQIYTRKWRKELPTKDPQGLKPSLPPAEKEKKKKNSVHELLVCERGSSLCWWPGLSTTLDKWKTGWITKEGIRRYEEMFQSHIGIRKERLVKLNSDGGLCGPNIEPWSHCRCSAATDTVHRRPTGAVLVKIPHASSFSGSCLREWEHAGAFVVLRIRSWVNICCLLRREKGSLLQKGWLLFPSWTIITTLFKHIWKILK